MASAETADRIVKSALDLAAERGWRTLTLLDIAERSGLSLDELYRHFPGKSAILHGIGGMVDRAVLAGGPADLEEPPRDRLFEIMMRRFDTLATHREGVLAILGEMRMDPLTVLAHLPSLTLSMRWMLEAAAMPATGLLGEARVRALGLIYVLVLRVWMTDDSPDMATTMRELDSRLRQAEQLANTFGRMPGPGSRSEPPRPPESPLEPDLASGPTG